MVRFGKTEKMIIEKLKKDNALHFTVVDPNDCENSSVCANVVKKANSAGTDMILLRPSLGASPLTINKCAREIRACSNLPVVLLPTNVGDISQEIDALFFVTLLNSRNIYWMVGAQALGAPVVKMLGVEAIPTAYLVIEPGATLSWMGDVKPIPANNSRLAATHALGGEYFGMRYLYLETGAKSKVQVPRDMIEEISKTSDIAMIVEAHGADEEHIKSIVDAGAKIIVTEYRDDLKSVVEAIKTSR
ncbi:MAG: phosphoglycerol geranylgeranyltransferase [archaeon]|nr:phosphoglycerol geranylgeranyltransferase [archaeon]